MKLLATVDRIRLARMLTLLSSPDPAVRDATGKAAHRLVRERGMTWRRVLEPPPVVKRLPLLGTWRATVTACLERPAALRPWEVVFLRDLPAFRRLSVKQRYLLVEIARRVLPEVLP